MSFMQPQITTRRTWYEIDTNCGTWFVDTADVDGGKIGEVIRQTDFPICWIPNKRKSPRRCSSTRRAIA